MLFLITMLLPMSIHPPGVLPIQTTLPHTTVVPIIPTQNQTYTKVYRALVLVILCTPILAFILCHCIICIRGCICYRKKTKIILNHQTRLTKSNVKTLNDENRKKEKYDDTPECVICLLPTNTKKSVTLFCGHRFHTKCINRWIKTQFGYSVEPACPMCKERIFSVITYDYSPDYSSDDSYHDY
jgi:hypothetical protein